MATVNPVANQGMSAFQDTTNFLQNSARNEFALDQQKRLEQERQAVDAAIRNAYAQSRQPNAPQSMLAEQSIQNGVPSPMQAVQRQQLDAPAGFMQQGSPTANVEQVSAKAPVPPPMTPQNFQDMLSRTAGAASPQQPAPSYQPILDRATGTASSAPPTPVNQTVSPQAVSPQQQIDPQVSQPQQPTTLRGQSYNQALSANLANVPGGGTLLDKAQAQQDKDIAGVLEMAGNGHVEEARFMAQQKGLQIPEEILGNADVSRGMSMANTAYPGEPDKGQAFFMAFMQSGGTTRDRVMSGIRAAGPPDNASQRALANALAIADYNAKKPTQYIGPDGILTNVSGNTATPVLDQSGSPFKPTTGAGGRSLGGTSSSSRRFVAVAGTGLVDTMAEGGPRVIVPAGQAFNVEEATQKIYLEMASDTQNFGRPPAELLQEARQIAQQIWSGNTGGLTGSGAAPVAPTAAAVLQPPPATGLAGQTVNPTAAVQSGSSQKVRVRYNGQIMEIDRSDLPEAQQNGAILING